jgi:hypothetical protein
MQTVESATEVTGNTEKNDRATFLFEFAVRLYVRQASGQRYLQKSAQRSLQRSAMFIGPDYHHSL